MPQLIVAALILWAIVSGPRWLAREGKSAFAKLVKRGAGSVALVVAAMLLILRGNLEAAAALAALGMGLLTWSEGKPGVPFGFGFGPASPGQLGPRLFRSRTIELEVDAATRALRGRVLAGALSGRALAELSEAQCKDLLSECRLADPYGARLLESYLDRRFPRWRTAGEGDENARSFRRAGSQSMTEDDAYEMLGLAKGAPREEITHAHRALMKKVHPDHGGTTSLAALLNEAKDVLLRRHV